MRRRDRFHFLLALAPHMVTKPGESLLEMVERHVREGETHVNRQREILRDLREKGLPTEMAEMLLLEFETTLKSHRQHLAHIRTNAH